MTFPSPARSFSPGAIILFLILAISSTLRAQPAPQSVFLPGAVGFPCDRPGSPSHGWMIVQSNDKWALVHVPPRVDNDPTATGVLSASGGSVALVGSFDSTPSAIVAIDDRLYMIFETVDRGGAVLRRDVRSVVAERSGLGALWHFEPEDDYFTHALLPPGGTLLGAACAQGTLAVVLDSSTEPNPQGPRVGVLSRESWVFSDLPEPVAQSIRASPGSAHVVSSRQGLLIAILRQNKTLERWVGNVEIPQPAAGGFFPDDDDAPIVTPRRTAPPKSPTWTWTRLAPIDARPLDQSSGTLLECAGVQVWLQVGPDGTMSVHELGDDSVSLLASLKNAAVPVSLCTIEGDGRIVMAWSLLEPPPSQPQAFQTSVPKRNYEVREISVLTGRVLYSGPAKSLGPVSETDFRLLALALLATMAIALLLVLRPDPSDGVISIPDNYFLAESGRRLFAALADAVLAWWIACAIWRLDVGQSLSPSNMLGGTTWIVAGTAIVVGLVLGSIGEWRIGRTPGKLLTGCEVISVLPNPSRPGALPRPSLWRALERNAIKWLLPPVAMLGLFDEQGRHRADMMARTVVVVRGDEMDLDERE